MSWRATCTFRRLLCVVSFSGSGKELDSNLSITRKETLSHGLIKLQAACQNGHSQPLACWQGYLGREEALAKSAMRQRDFVELFTPVFKELGGLSLHLMYTSHAYSKLRSGREACGMTVCF